ncbi:MAG TPA: hypothetical protein VGS11_00500 [Candidatus Bathyarchaeia archaeon]|nr:hypothetical protein [Candidatus Bathyarchaeia archaeon]
MARLPAMSMLLLDDGSIENRCWVYSNMVPEEFATFVLGESVMGD